MIGLNYAKVIGRFSLTTATASDPAGLTDRIEQLEAA